MLHLNIVIFAFAILALLIPCLSFAAKQSSNDENTMKFVQHQIFQNLYARPSVEAPRTRGNSKVKTYLNRLKQSTRLNVVDGLSVSLSRVKSGPMDSKITQMVKVAPGLQTHEGIHGDASKGYGVKFSFKY